MNSAKNESKIKILPDFVANQIAAGEVVQRPESVVKELVENSLDSGADTIAVVVRDAGKKLVHVADNGSGMNREDLELSIKRHATSKIMTHEDLEEIRTFGFRGEALASIASVASIEIRSRRERDDFGLALVAEPMSQTRIEPISMDFGTQIFVRNLFYNVPARKKFLKSNLTEFRYISETMIRFALVSPEKNFAFYDGDHLIFNVKKESPESRVRALFGEEIGREVIPVDFENDYIKIEGFVGRPNVAKRSRSNQYLFLNGRSVESKSLGYAVFSAFEHLLEKSKKPIYILNLIVDPKDVDVNVHPQKREVKFEEERFVFSSLNRAVSEALKRENLVPRATFAESSSKSPFEKIELGGRQSNASGLVNKDTGEIIDYPNYPSKPNFKTGNDDFISRRGFSGTGGFRDERSGRPTKEELSAFDEIFSDRSVHSTNVEKDQADTERLNDYSTVEKKYWQLHKKYVFVKTEEGAMIIDQHAAHERILYEKALKTMKREFSKSQNLLFETAVDLDSSERTLAEELSEDLRKLGFDFSLKESQAILKGVPIDASHGDETTLFKEVLDGYREFDEIRESGKRDNLAASFGCKSAIKTGQKLSDAEIERLIEDLFKCEVPYACPHGRPIIIEITLDELDKRFSRT